MAVTVDIQFAYSGDKFPDISLINKWVNAVLIDLKKDAELTIRIVDETEAKELNERWSKSKGATNVLSFPANDAMDILPDLLGDIIICAPVVEREATQQSKPLKAHWAHMIIHGTLHLLGYDHINENDAKIMESIEINTLANLGFLNPYS